MLSISERHLAMNLPLQLVTAAPLASSGGDRVGDNDTRRRPTPCYRSCSRPPSPIGHPPGLESEWGER